MAFTTKKIIAGNWKMNGIKTTAWQLTNDLLNKYETPDDNLGFQIILCPPFTLLSEITAMVDGSPIQTCAQNCADHENGAYTGEISPEMVKDLGAKYILLGHSERRNYYNETSELVSIKATLALSHGLTPIICIGETLEQKEAGSAEAVIEDQLTKSLPPQATDSNVIIAYEPVWAIGTGKVATLQDIISIHEKIRQVAAKILGTPDITILYGGSVKAANAKEIFSTPEVNGVLVGGASLKADEFWDIAMASI